jgi:NADH-quinone oxidoreductase subunit N
LVLFATAGMTLIAAAADLIVMFLALEILSLSLYVLTGITGSRRGNEAAMKYFLLGAFASAFFLYGVAMAYGAVDTTNIVQIVRAMSGQTGTRRWRCCLRVPASGSGSRCNGAAPHGTRRLAQGAPTRSRRTCRPRRRWWRSPR